MSEKELFLADYSRKELWQSPGQDIQHTVSPEHITPIRGVLGKVDLGMYEVNLPTKSDWYSVFVFGDIPHFMVGVDEFIDRWVSVEYLGNKTNTLITIYNNEGIVYPCYDAYFLYTRSGQVAVALKDSRKTINTAKDQIFVKWRTAAYFKRISGSGTLVSGRLIANMNDLNTMIGLFNALRQKEGYAWAYRNGRRVNRIHGNMVQIGDIVEVVWDGSVREVLKYQVRSLEVFDSTLDKKSKYLIDQIGYGETVDFHDDLDIFVLAHRNDNEYDGVYYHHNHDDSIRNITHRDFSIPTSYISGIIDNNSWTLSDDLRIEVLIRHSGWDRPVPTVYLRLYEMFRLDHPARVQAMVGEHALVPEWTAANLEASTFNELIADDDGYIERSLATDVLGYNVISGLTSQVVYERGEMNSFRLAYHLRYRSTVFEYNQHGRLLGYYKHSLSANYRPQSEHCAYIEVYFGWHSSNMGTVFGKQEQQLDGVSDYRYYIAKRLAGNKYEEWTDVTGDHTKYHIDGNNRLLWLVNQSQYLTAVRRDCDFLTSEVTLDRIDRLLLLSIQTDQVYQDRGELKGWLEIPPGELDVFLNGYHLIEGIDYHVNWPEICIVNKLHRSQNIDNQVTVRARGFCNSDMTRPVPKDVGFVYNRMMGRRDQYQTLNDKNLVIHSGGRLLPVTKAFTEDWVRKELPSGYNGQPYQIRCPVTPLKDIPSRSTTELLNEALEFDSRVEDYLTDRLGIADTDEIRDVDQKYIVVSPLLNKLIHDLLNGIFSTDEFEGEYSEDTLMKRIARYNYLLPYEPSRQSSYYSQFMEIHPHPYPRAIEVNVHQYRIIDRVTRILFGDDVTLARNLLIIESGYEHDARYHPHPRRI